MTIGKLIECLQRISAPADLPVMLEGPEEGDNPHLATKVTVELAEGENSRVIIS